MLKYSHRKMVDKTFPPRGALQEVVDLYLDGDTLAVPVVVVVHQPFHLRHHGLVF